MASRLPNVSPSDAVIPHRQLDKTYLARLVRAAKAEATIDAAAAAGGDVAADIILRRVRLPVRAGGLGIRAMSDIAAAAFVAGACAAVPHLTPRAAADGKPRQVMG